MTRVVKLDLGTLDCTTEATPTTSPDARFPLSRVGGGNLGSAPPSCRPHADLVGVSLGTGAAPQSTRMATEVA